MHGYCGVRGFEESGKLSAVQVSIAANARTYVQSEWGHLFNRLPYILGGETACKKNRNVNLLPNLTAQGPVVDSTGAAKFLNGERLIAGIEQQRVHERCYCDRFFNRFRAGYVYHLDDGNSR